MNLSLSGHHLLITPAIRDYVTVKLDRVTRHFDHVIDVNVVLSVDKLRQQVTANLHIRGKDIHDDGSSEVITAPHDLVRVRQLLAEAGLKSDFAEVAMKPTVEVECRGEDAVRMQKLLDALEALDDVQDVYTTAVIVE